VAVINGVTLTNSENSFALATARFGATLDFVEGFSGTFDTITVDNTFSFSPAERKLGFAVPSVDGQRFQSLGLQGIDATALGGEDGTLSMLATGGILAGLDDAAQSAGNIADEALVQLDALLASIDSFQTNTIDTAKTVLQAEQTEINSSLTVLSDRIEADEAAANAKAALLQQNNTRNVAANSVNGRSGR
jgi:hypothetical protein